MGDSQFVLLLVSRVSIHWRWYHLIVYMCVCRGSFLSLSFSPSLSSRASPVKAFLSRRGSILVRLLMKASINNVVFATYDNSCESTCALKEGVNFTPTSRQGPITEAPHARGTAMRIETYTLSFVVCARACMFTRFASYFENSTRRNLLGVLVFARHFSALNSYN